MPRGPRARTGDGFRSQRFSQLQPHDCDLGTGKEACLPRACKWTKWICQFRLMPSPRFTKLLAMCRDRNRYTRIESLIRGRRNLSAYGMASPILGVGRRQRDACKSFVNQGWCNCCKPSQSTAARQVKVKTALDARRLSFCWSSFSTGALRQVLQGAGQMNGSSFASKTNTLHSSPLFRSDKEASGMCWTRVHQLGVVCVHSST